MRSSADESPHTPPSEPALCHTQQIADFIKAIPSWTDEEQAILDKNITKFPAEATNTISRMTLLLTHLPNKRLRDISLRLKYLDARVQRPQLAWNTFIGEFFRCPQLAGLTGTAAAVLAPGPDPPVAALDPLVAPPSFQLHPQPCRLPPVLSCGSPKIPCATRRTPSARRAAAPRLAALARSTESDPFPVSSADDAPDPDAALYDQLPPASLHTAPILRPAVPPATLPADPPDDELIDDLIAANEECIDKIVEATVAQNLDFEQEAAAFCKNTSTLVSLSEQLGGGRLPAFFFAPIALAPPDPPSQQGYRLLVQPALKKDAATSEKWTQ